MIIDSHAHLIEVQKKDPQTFSNFIHILQNEKNFKILDVGINLSDIIERRDLHRQLNIADWSLGIYPSYAQDKNRTKLLIQLSELIAQEKPSAIGECGIDWFRNYGAGQMELFVGQLSLAGTYQLPVIIHCREAEKDIFVALQGRKNPTCGIMHCYSGNLEYLDKFLDQGMYISFAGNITYPSAQNLRTAAKYVPLDRLLIESDCPYLAPLADRRTTNTPQYCSITLALIAELIGKDPLDLGEHIMCNMNNLLTKPNLV